MDAGLEEGQAQVQAPPMLVPSKARIAFCAVAGPGLLPAAALLHRIEQREFGIAQVTPGALADRLLDGTLFAEKGAEELPAFALVCHPLRRLHAAFVDDLFGAGWQQSPFRRVLRDRHGPIPGLKAIATGKTPLAPHRHREIFLTYLGIVQRASRGKGVFGMRQIWTAQANLCDAARAKVGLDHVGRLEDFTALAHWVTQTLGIADLPQGQVNGISKSGQVPQLPLSQVADAEVIAFAQDLHAPDFQAFDYAPDPAG